MFWVWNFGESTHQLMQIWLQIPDWDSFWNLNFTITWITDDVCVADRAWRCDWAWIQTERFYWQSRTLAICHSMTSWTRPIRSGGHAPEGSTPVEGRNPPRWARWGLPVNIDPPRRSFLLQLLEVYRSRRVLMQKQSAQSIPAALNHYTINTSAKVSSSSGLLQAKNAHLISSWVTTFGKSSDIT